MRMKNASKIHLISRWFIRTTLGLMLLLIMPNGFSQAQPNPQLVARSERYNIFNHIGWSQNNQALIYLDTSTIEGQWVQFDLLTNQMATTPQQPFVPAFQPDLLGTPDPNFPSYMPFISTSPSGRYLLYEAPRSAGEWSDGRPLIALTDLTTNNTAFINLPLNNWSAKWSSDSDAVVIDTTTNYGGNRVYYLKNFVTSVSQVEAVEISNEIVVDDLKGALASVYGLSSNSLRVLVGTHTRLSVWDFGGSNVIESFARDQIAGGAAFTPDETGALYLTAAGMFRYDFATQQTTSVLLEAGAELLEDAVQAVISPDGKHVAVVVFDRATNDYALYILNVVEGQ